jgi:hypothetical protein
LEEQIRIPSNVRLERDIAELLTRMGRPARKEIEAGPATVTQTGQQKERFLVEAALSLHPGVFGLVKRRLKALPRGHPSQDWLPHNLC